MLTVDAWLMDAARRGASDLHLAVGGVPRIRVDGVLVPLPEPAVSTGDLECLIDVQLSDTQRAAFAALAEVDWSFAVPGVGRVRANLFRQRGTLAVVFRLIPGRVPTLDALCLPDVVTRLVERPRGLVLVTGPTGSGKSTTLAAMVDWLNRTRPVHILTIEDPIEFEHQSQRALVTQRELRADTSSYPAALRAALREDPDVVLVGELRDRDTMEAALTLAETGHLTLATLHTNSAPQTISRVIDAFPAHQHSQVRSQLSLVLEGVICQALLPRAQGAGRVAAFEILVATPAARALIRDDKIHQLISVMQTGGGTHGMRTMRQSLTELVASGSVAADVARRIAGPGDEGLGAVAFGGRV